MFPQISIRHSIGNIIEIPNELNPKVFTYLSNNFAIGTTVLSVDNAIGLSNNTTVPFVTNATASTDIETLVSGTCADYGIVNGSAIVYTGASHDNFVHGTTYYAGTVSGSTFKAYSDAGLSTVVPVTVDTSGYTWELMLNNFITVLGTVGAENCEFGYASASTNQTITVIATKQPHNRGDLVTQVNYDQVEISKSSTINGSYSVLATLSLFVTQQKTIQFDPAGATTDYYKLRWKNSITNAFSGYSEPQSVLSYPTESVGSVIYPVLTAMGISPNDPKITIPFCIEAINDARKYVKAKLYGVRHAWLEQFEFPIQVLAGSNFVNLPEDIDFNETDRSMLSGRFIMNNVLAPFNLKYIDKRSWNQIAFNVGGSFTVGDTLAAATELNIFTAGDFLPANNQGVAYVATTAFDELMLQIQYTGIDLVEKKLTGVTGITRAIPGGTQVWVTPTIAQPITYTVYNNDTEGGDPGRIVFDRIIPDSMQGNNFYIDYYKKFLEVTDLYQRLPEPYREIYKWYLRYAIKYRKDITLAQSDPDYKKFEDLVQALFNNLYTGQSTTIVTS